VIDALEHEFPGARALRWDWDVTRSKGAHDAILESFSNHKADVLVGTQMLAKGLDLPLVTVVGVISADIGLNLPDFRASERTFQVLTQVAGRAGRSHLGGQVVLQTYQPDHYVVQSAAQHDYQDFYQQELRFRKQLEYPPYQRLTRLLVTHTSNQSAERLAREMAEQIQYRAKHINRQVTIIGPAPCFYSRLRGLYRWQIVLRALEPHAIIPEALPESWSVDVDPVSLL
jgi:primosomal protein N' (replication factor Y)